MICINQRPPTIFDISAFADQSSILGLCIALGIGLLIGAERERHKGTGPGRRAAGIRTFAVAALLGAIAMLLDGGLLIAVAALIIGGLTIVAYQRSHEHDPGMTTEISLVLTCLLGGLAMREPAVAAGVGAGLAMLLAARNRIHFFVRSVLSERELHDALLFSAAVLIVLPLMPDRFMGPFHAINPHAIASLIVLVMAISALGYIAMRVLGMRFGLPLAGLAAGFISSTATIYSMGVRARRHAEQMKGAAAAAVLSSVATVIQLAAVLLLIEPALLKLLMLPLILSGLSAGGYSLLFILKLAPAGQEPAQENFGRAFDLKTAVIFAIIVTVVITLSAGLSSWLGQRGTLLAAGVSGLVDAHAAAASVASLAAADKLPAADAVWPVLLAFTTNTVMKAVLAIKVGGAEFSARIVPGLLLMVAAVWLGAWLQ